MRAALSAAAALIVVMILTTVGLLAVPVMAPAIAADTGLPASLVGAYSFAIWTGALVTSIYAGRLIPKLGAVRVEQLCLAVAGAGLLLGASGSVVALALSALFMGLGVGLETPASSEILARVSRPGDRPLVFSLKQTGVQVGGMLAGLLLPVSLPALGWRGALALVGGATLAYALALEPLRRRMGHALPEHPPRGATAPAAFRLVLGDRTLRHIATASFTFHAVQVCLNTFLVSFLVAQHGLPLTEAGALLALAQAGGFLGRLGLPFIVGPRLPVGRLLIVVGFGMTACALAVGLGAGVMAPWLLACFCCLFGFSASGWNGVFLAEVARLAGDHIARVTGGVLVLAYAGLILGPVAFSLVAAMTTLGAGFALLGAGSFAGTLVLVRSRLAERRL